MTAGVEGGAHFVLKQTTYESLETPCRNHRERRRPPGECQTAYPLRTCKRRGPGWAEGRMTTVAACLTCGS